MAAGFRLDSYLERIGFQGTLRSDLTTLAALHAAHVDAIPFENFDPLLRRPVDLDLASVQRKLVDSRRGGYCFEQNALFRAALEAVGFRVTGLSGRVRWMSPPEAPLGPRVHMLLKVDLDDGSYLADVGFGARLLDTPLQFATDVEQSSAMGTYRLSAADGLYALSARQPDDWREMYVFNLEPQFPSDYELGNWFTSTSPAAPFLSNLIVERLSRDTRYKLVNRRFITEARDGRVVDERAITDAAELHRLLDETFRITPPAPIEQIFQNLN
ncbi:MAG: arylamine N-acetyltransferase [Rhodopseudomonas sp.]|uniref:arylamine N-acetyltransferase family protein n=1 Tax=Rhodopseudomonas sp. TaxID=1078 RepID=UPI001844E9CB|nr:arylamine N-acetyltransferase [Rhodopseudomonas sp.]NVN86500.1 arylamine N-acetyltransferase [Rhodopseudomonas sp.]